MGIYVTKSLFKCNFCVFFYENVDYTCIQTLSHVSLTCSNSILIDNFNSSSKSNSLKMGLLKWYTLCKRMNITTKNLRKMCMPPHMLICSHISSCRFYFDYFLIYKSYLILNSLKGTDFLLVNAYSYCLYNWFISLYHFHPSSLR